MCPWVRWVLVCAVTLSALYLSGRWVLEFVFLSQVWTSYCFSHKKRSLGKQLGEEKIVKLETSFTDIFKTGAATVGWECLSYLPSGIVWPKYTSNFKTVHSLKCTVLSLYKDVWTFLMYIRCRNSRTDTVCCKVFFRWTFLFWCSRIGSVLWHPFRISQSRGCNLKDLALS